MPFAEDLESSGSGDIDDRSLGLGTRLAGIVNGRRQQCPKSVYIDHRAKPNVSFHVELAHANLSEITRMKLVKQNTVVMLASCITSASRMTAVLANTAMAR